MVVTWAPATAATGSVQDLSATPSTCTVQAPQAETPQPNLVPVSLSASRNTQSKGVSGSISSVRTSPLTVSVMAMASPLESLVPRHTLARTAARGTGPWTEGFG